MRKLDYRNKDDAKALADAIRSASEEHGPALAAILFDTKIMTIKPWFVSIMFKLVKYFRGSSYMLWLQIDKSDNKIFKNTINDFINEAANHIESGKDKTTNDAAGGLNQKEIDSLFNKLRED